MRAEKLLNEIVDFISDYCENIEDIGKFEIETDLTINGLMYGAIYFEVYIEDDELMEVDWMYYKRFKGECTLVKAEITQLTGELSDDLPNLRNYLNEQLTNYFDKAI